MSVSDRASTRTPEATRSSMDTALRDIVITSKLSPGQSAGGLLPRPRLHLDASSVKTLTLVSGPPGFGKTTLLATGYRAMKAQKTLVAWLTLDDDDQDIRQFMLYLAAALLHAGIDLSDLVARICDGLFKIPVRSTIPAILNRIEAERRPVVLFLDDYERAQSDAIDGLIRLLIERSPANFRLVVASRKTPNLGLSRLLARDALRRISASDLRFRDEEAIAYLRELVPTVHARLLSQRTEGWPVALSIARNWLEQGVIDPGVLGDFSGRHVDLARYLAEQVYASIDADLRAVLLDISVLDRISGDLLNAVIGCTDGWMLIERIEHQSLLLLPLDSSRYWFRLHNLFAEFLRDRLSRADPARVSNVHRAAAEWFVTARLLPEAVRHASLAGDPAFAAQIIEKAGGWRLALHGGMAMLRRFADFSAEIAYEFPYLRLGQIYLMVQDGQLPEARAALGQLKERTGNFGDASGPIWARISMDARILEFTLRLYEDCPLDLEDIVALEAEVVKLPGPDRLLLATTSTLACYATFNEGEYLRCHEVGRRALARAREADASYLENYLDLYLGAACLVLGSLEDARNHYQRVIGSGGRVSQSNPNQIAGAERFLAELA